jgi:hypothetical protein
VSFIRLEQPLSGGLGNQFFQVNFVLQIREILNCEIDIPKNKVFEICDQSKLDIGRKPTLNRFAKVFRISREFVIGEEASTLVNFCADKISSGIALQIPSGILGEVFYKFLSTDPRRMFYPELKYHKDLSENKVDSSRVAFHFRGTDFHDWKPEYVLDIAYYRRALKQLNLSPETTDLFTDDPLHPTVLQLKDEGIVGRVISRADHGSDFWNLANYETLVISPSTFAVWACLLGTHKTVIYDTNWFAKEGQKELFWKRFLKNSDHLMKDVVGI